MKKKLILSSAIVAVSILSACAQQEEPPVMVKPEPVYDKYGNAVHSSNVPEHCHTGHHEGDECYGIQN
jgi:hypothetical protein